MFEWVYFSRPDSTIAGISVYRARENMGRRLAVEHPVGADVVIPVPDSGTAAAIGYARESGIPFGQGLMRSHYAGRTFIEPSQSIRHFGVKLKLSPVREVLAGKRVVVVDDSIVRGTTSRKIIGMIRSAGAREIHMRISSPPTIGPCHYGIDTPSREELIASSQSVDEIRDFVGADSLGYLSLEGLHAAVGQSRSPDENHGLCDACFSNEYPIAVVPPGAPAPAAPDLAPDRSGGRRRWRPAPPRSRWSTARTPTPPRWTPGCRSCAAGFPAPSSIATWPAADGGRRRPGLSGGRPGGRRAAARRRLDLVQRRPARGPGAGHAWAAGSNVQDGSVLHVGDHSPCSWAPRPWSATG